MSEGPKRDLAALADTLRFAIDFHRRIDEKLGKESPNESWPENVAEIYLAVRDGRDGRDGKEAKEVKEERGPEWEAER